jgi:hypothetical protein
MRCLYLALAGLAPAALASAPAAGALAPHTEIVAGSAHRAGVQLRGWFEVANVGARRAPATGGHVTVNDGRWRLRLEKWVAPELAAAQRRRVRIAARVPARLGAGEWRIAACSEGRCLRIGTFWNVTAPGTAEQPGSSSAGAPKKTPPPPSSPKPTVSTVPPDPISHPVAEPFFHAGEGAEYWAFIPRSYDASNGTPTKLLVWAHGCGGHAEEDARVVDPGAQAGVEQDWMTLSLGGREGQCWAPSDDEPKVMAALADFETHFDVDRRQVFLGGFSAGGDLAYRTGFRHSSTFAGLLVENCSPFRDTESTQAESLGAASTRFHVAHLAHTADDIYPLTEIQAEIAAARAAGFPVDLIERPGGHWDEPGDIENGLAVPGTDADLRSVLLPYLDAGWTSP